MLTKRTFIVAAVAFSLVLAAAAAERGPNAAASETNQAVFEPVPTADVSEPLEAASTPDKIAEIKNKQIRLVDQVCGTLEQTAEFVADQPALAALAPGLEEQKTKCGIAEEVVGSMTDDEIRSVALKRTSAVIYAEYTGPNRSMDHEGAGEPVWAPGHETLEGAEYLGNEYEYDGDGDGVCNVKGNAPSEVETLTVAAASANDHGKKLTGYSEWCAEVIGDGIGDDDGFCERQDPPGKDKTFEEPCVAIQLPLEDVEENEENVDQSAFDDYSALLDDALAGAEAAQIAADSIIAEFGSTRGMAVAESALCDAPLANVSFLELATTQTLWIGMDTMEKVVDYASEQSVLGTNASAAQIWVVALYGAAELAYMTVELLADWETAENVINTLTCLDDLAQLSQSGMAELGENIAGLSYISLRVLELKEKSRYLVSAAISGQPVSGLAFTSVKLSLRDPVVFEELAADVWTATEVAPGAYEITLDLPANLRNVDLYMFDVEHLSADGRVVYGHVIADRTMMGASG